jgi:hypothetical protein
VLGEKSKRRCPDKRVWTVDIWSLIQQTELALDKLTKRARTYGGKEMTTIKAKPWSELTSFTTPQWLKDQKYGIYTHWGALFGGRLWA